MKLATKFIAFIREQQLFKTSDKLLLAVSGGIDSSVLCALCFDAGFEFSIAHCNFHLRGEESDNDEQFVRQLAEQYGVKCYVNHFDTNTIAKNTKRSVELTARELRYKWFDELIETHSLNYILTAHHKDDNIETVMMHFFRGTGIKGLRGILPKQQKIIRPLLFARKHELEEFVSERGLSFVTDNTNASDDYTRNFFRNQVIPLIAKKIPEAESNILKNIHRFSETELLYKQAIDLHKKNLLEKRGNEIHIPVLKLQRVIPLNTIVYEIIEPYGFTAHQTEEVIGLLKSDSGKFVSSASHRILRNRNWLIISPFQNRISSNVLIQANDLKVDFAEGFITMKMSGTQPVNKDSNQLLAQINAKDLKFPLLLRKWKHGDYFYPLGMDKKKKISRFLIDQKLSLLQKEATWVIESDKKIIWVVGLRIDNRFKLTPDTKDVISFELVKKTADE